MKTTFGLLGLYITGSSGFAPIANPRFVDTKLGMSEGGGSLASTSSTGDNLEVYAGEGPTLTPNTYVDPENELLALEKKSIPAPIHYAERMLTPTGLQEIRAQQLQHGIHTSSDGTDYTRNVQRH